MAGGVAVEHAGADVDRVLVQEDAHLGALRRRLALVGVALHEVGGRLGAQPIGFVETAVDDDGGGDAADGKRRTWRNGGLDWLPVCDGHASENQERREGAARNGHGRFSERGNCGTSPGRRGLDARSVSPFEYADRTCRVPTHEPGASRRCPLGALSSGRPAAARA